MKTVWQFCLGTFPDGGQSGLKLFARFLSFNFKTWNVNG
jgi:hypothetical protein